MAPCNYRHTESDEVDEMCNRDPYKQLESFDSYLNMRILYNEERFDPTKYGDDKIIKESTMSKMKFDFNFEYPEQLNLKLMQQELEDETDMLQFG